MSIVLDLIVVAIVVISTIVTMKKGFVKTTLSLASWILTIWIISSFGGMISEAIYDGAFEKKVIASIEAPLTQQLESGEEALDGVFDSLPSFVSKSMEKKGVGTESIMSEISNGKTPRDIALTVNNTIVEPTVLPLILIVVDIILFVVLMFIFRILTKLISALFKVPVLKSVNKFLGAILGIVRGLVISVLVCSIISFIAAYGFDGQFLIFTEKSIEASFLFGKLAGVLNLTAFVY